MKNHHIICQIRWKFSLSRSRSLSLSFSHSYSFILEHLIFSQQIGWVYTFNHPVYIHSQQSSYILMVLLLCVLFSLVFRLLHSSCFETFEESFRVTELSSCAILHIWNSRVFLCFWLFPSMQTSESAFLECVYIFCVA